MKFDWREELVVRRIHRNALFVIVAIVTAGALVAVTIHHGELLGPIVTNARQRSFLKWSISDHYNNNANSLLQNSLFANDEPEYQGDIILNLQRSGDGGLEALPRYQGKLEYHAN